jgi:hypothetical protein
MVNPMIRRAIAGALVGIVFAVADVRADPLPDESSEDDHCISPLTETKEADRPKEIVLCHMGDDQNPVPDESQTAGSLLGRVLLFLDLRGGSVQVAIIASDSGLSPAVVISP